MSSLKNKLRDAVFWQILVTGIYLLIATLALAWAPVDALQWFKHPFLGAFIEHSLVLNGVGPSNPDEAWELYRVDNQFGSQLISINGEPVPDSATYRKILRQYYPGESVTITLEKPSGERRTYQVTLQKIPSRDFFNFFDVPYLIGLIFLVMALFVFFSRKEESQVRIFTLFSASLAMSLGLLFNIYTSHTLTHLWVLSLAITGGAMIGLSSIFPQEWRLVRKHPWARWTGLAIGLLLYIWNLPALFNYAHPRFYVNRWVALYAFIGFSGFVFLANLLYYAITASSPITRNQARTVLAGTLLGFSPMLGWILHATFSQTPINFHTYLFSPMVIFPAALGYAVLRYRIVRADYLFSRGLMMLLLGVSGTLAYALLAAGLTLLAQSTYINTSLNSPITTGAVIVVVVLLLSPLRERLQNMVDSIFFRNQQIYQQRLQTFSHELTNSLDMNSIVLNLRRQIIEALSPETIHIYVYDPAIERYTATIDEKGAITSDITFPKNTPLANWLKAEHLPLYITDEYSMPQALKPLSTRFALLRASLFVAIPGQNQLNGWLALGLRLSGQNYSSNDIRFLESLADQTALALDRIQSVANLQRRLQELNALTRVAQGVNITLNFDDMLELIYAQTSQIIPIDDLHITLYNIDGGFYYHAFCLENNERLQEKENVRLPDNEDLAPIIIRNAQNILADDYVSECRRRDVIPSSPDIHSWMGVPLNTGTRTIGAITAGLRNPAITYTQSQLNTLKSIADLTAGAIIKSQLLRESEKRAAQLSTLNTIAQQLTSTLELEPLLQTITENATRILNSSAGSLLLVDEDTDELVFKVVTGPVAEDLKGTRIGRNVGFVGRAIQTRRAVIVNDAQRTHDLYDEIDNETGYTTNNLIAVPLITNDRILGVIEIINRKDGLPFSQEDSNLLEAFAGQAAVAIENARLYTLTDQELAARVEELSVMQRIDRELNASLNVDRAMRITLEWALRQSQAEAGFIGVLDAEGSNLRIMAQDGYGEALNEYGDEKMMPIDPGGLQTAIKSGQPQILTLSSSEQNEGFLSNAQTQIIIPIKRETRVIGLFVLESSQEMNEAVVNFLVRLSDHAAIAITNAQLFQAAEQANAAKTDFISFVAHELKNPMTSIKGYTDLLAKGAVGPINDMQANFLKTIANNVERMSTLVSDLNDNSKIEAGRLHLDYSTVIPQEIIEDAIRSMRQQMDEKEQTLELQIPEDLPPIWADKTRISQVMVNLVSNAYKYTPAGGHIIIGAEHADNQWDPDGAPEVVHIWVKDDGIGISPEDQKKIFQKFFRSEDEKTREAPGTGLGLNITKGLVELQGGRIWFESEFRKGTTFHFTVPVASAVQEASE